MKTQWQIYKELELIPDAVPDPEANRSIALTWLAQRWHLFIDRWIAAYPCEHQVSHLARCLELEFSGSKQPGLWHRAWHGLTHLLESERSASASLEPQIRQVADLQGHLWWLAYDPITHQTAYLASEEEVKIWLDERLYH